MSAMFGRSLRLRLGALGAAAILAALCLALLGQSLLFQRHIERRIGAELNVYLDQLAAAASFDAAGALSAPALLSDPRFERVYGGLYWQVRDVGGGGLRRSRSLWDQALSAPQGAAKIGEITAHTIRGPNGADLLAHERRLILPVGDAEQAVQFIVAVERREIAALTRAFAWETALGLGLLGALLIGASVMQLALGLRPLARLRQRVTEVRSGSARRLRLEAPSEIAPLVEEVNALLDAHERSIERARRRAGDLAHGFNTPLTSLLADARRLRESGQTEIAGQIEETVRAMRRQIERELSQARVANDRGAAPECAVEPLIEGLLRTLARTPAAEHVAFLLDLGEAPETLRVAAAEEDLAEILGNLLENAARFAASTVKVAARESAGVVRFCVEDDGPGVAEHQRAAILDRGLRLDRSGAGSGLGLAIVKDVLERYEAELALQTASLGGLAAAFALPTPNHD